MTDRNLRCTAGHIVGMTLGPQDAGVVLVRTQGREVLAYGVILIRCLCGAAWRPDAPRLPLDDLERKAPQLVGRR